MKTDLHKASRLQGVWDFLSSVRLTIFLLLFLAATSIVGTLVPQNESPAVYLHKYGYSEGLYRFLSALGIFDMYRSWWFQAILFLLAVNLVACSFKRLPATWKIVNARNPGFRQDRFAKATDKETFWMNMAGDRALEAVLSLVSRRFRFRRVEAAGPGFTLYAEKGRWTRLGPYIIHAGFLCVLAGGLIGSMSGFMAYVDIPVGEEARIAYPANSDKEIPLPFAVRCDDFSVTYNQDGSPKEYRSTLTLLKGHKPLLTRDIIVNDPLRFEGISLYQSGWGVARPAQVRLTFTDSGTGSQTAVAAPLGKRLPLPDGTGAFAVSDFQPSFFVHGHDWGPMFVLDLFPQDMEPGQAIVFVKDPEFDKRRAGGFVISVSEYKPRYYTGLQVTRDPGVWVVYAGFILVIAGCFITFFLSHQRLYVKAEAKQGGTRITLGAEATRNQQGNILRAKRLAERLKDME